MSKRFIATLVRGTTFYYRTKRFDRNVPVTISQELKEYLEENAVDRLKADKRNPDDVVVRPKFSFEEVKDEKAKPAKAKKAKDATVDELAAEEGQADTDTEDSGEGDDTPDTPRRRRTRA